MKTEKKEAIIAYLLVLAGTVVYISLIFNQNVWLDEAFTASLVRTDMAGVLERSMNDTLPPLYNIILKLMTDLFGYQVPIMKLTSAIPMILTMLLGATTIRKRFGPLTSYLFIAAIAVMPNMLFYGVEIRMYSLGFFFATASGVYAYEAVCDSNRKNWILLTLFSVLAGYSHHFAFVTVGFIYLFLLLYYFFFEREHIRRWFLCLLATFVLYFPCLLVTLKQFGRVSGYFSMPEVTLSVFIKYMRYPYTVGMTFVSIALVLLMLLLLLKFCWNKKRNRADYFALLCFLTYYGVLVFGTIISKLMTANIFVDRYLFFAIGLIWLFFAIEAGTMRRDFIYIIFAFEIVIGIIGYRQAYLSEYAEGIDTLTTYLDANVVEEDVLYTLEDFDELACCLPFYAPELTNYEELSDAIKAADGAGKVLWCAVMDGYEYDESVFDSYGLKMEFIGEFRFDRYIFKLYKLINK